MAAVHRRKRPIGSNADGSRAWDNYKFKKKKFDSITSRFNSKSHISLEWDDRKDKVVAKKDQISLSTRVMRPFSASVSHNHNSLADVISVPSEIFGLENLNGILSNEVWKTILSENERKSLVQFLPLELDEDIVVDTLLSGDNFHFGNAFLQWGSKLCSGNLHPDFVFSEEECLMDYKKGYYSEIHKYHADMIQYLQKLKGALEDNKATDMKDLQEIWRPRKGQDYNTSKFKYNYRFKDFEEEVAASSNSSSWNEEDKACSDNQVSSMMKSRLLQQRIHQTVSRDHRKCLLLSDDFGKAENMDLHNIDHGDGASYMSYVKVSKKQYDLVKRLKQSGKIIHSKTLCRLLGTTGGLNVQPFEEFEKEEMKKLHDLWLKLVNVELPTAYVFRRERQENGREMRMLLCQDIEERVKAPEDHQIANCELIIQDTMAKGVLPCNSNVENECDEETSEHQLVEQTDRMSGYQRDCFESDEDDRSIPFRAHVNHSSTIPQGSMEAYEDDVSDSNHSIPQEFQAASDSNHSAPQVFETASNLNHSREQLFQTASDSNHSIPQEFEEDDVPSRSDGHSLNSIDGDSANIVMVSNSKNELPEASDFPIKENTLETSIEPLIQFSSVRSMYMSDSITANTSAGCRVSITSGNGYSHVADNRDTTSMYGVGFSSSRDIYSLNVHNVVPSINQRATLSSNGGMYGVDANSSDPSVNHGVALSSVGGFYTVDGNDADISVGQRVPTSSGGGVRLVDATNVGSPILQESISCGKDGWPMVNIGSCYYGTGGKEYPSSHDVPLSSIGAQQSSLIDMEDNTRKRLIQRHCDDSSFNSYPIPDGSGLLQSLFNGQDISYQTEPKHNGLNFRPQSSVLLQDGPFSGSMHGNLHSLMAIEQGKKVAVENYISQGGELYPESNGYIMPRQGHMNLQDWTPNSVRMQSQVQSHIPHEGMLAHKWYSGEPQIRGNWSHSNGVSSSVSSQSIETSADQGLYSVLQCNQLPSDGPFDTIPSNGQLMLPRNYAMMSSGGSRGGNSLPQLPHPLEFFGGRDSSASSIMPNSSGWMNLPQNSSSHDSLGKPFLRSWNQ